MNQERGAPKKKPKPRRTSFGKGGKRPDIPVPIRSAWEANFYRLLRYLQEQGNVKEFEYEPQEFEFPVKRGERFYTPDFKITYDNGIVEWVEIKGYMDAKSKTKLNRMKKFYPQIEIKLIGHQAWLSLQDRKSVV